MKQPIPIQVLPEPLKRNIKDILLQNKTFKDEFQISDKKNSS